MLWEIPFWKRGEKVKPSWIVVCFWPYSIYHRAFPKQSTQSFMSATRNWKECTWMQDSVGRALLLSCSWWPRLTGQPPVDMGHANWLTPKSNLDMPWRMHHLFNSSGLTICQDWWGAVLLDYLGYNQQLLIFPWDLWLKVPQMHPDGQL
jgi:hypothetical protein